MKDPKTQTESNSNEYSNQNMHLIKYNLWQVLNSYMFRQRSAFLRGFYNKEIQVQHANLGSASPLLDWLKY